MAKLVAYQIEHTRHRPVVNFLVNMIAGVTVYYHKKKPSLNLTEKKVFGCCFLVKKKTQDSG